MTSMKSYDAAMTHEVMGCHDNTHDAECREVLKQNFLKRTS